MKYDFIWDAENLDHIAKHGVTVDEVQKVVQDRNSIETTSNDRYHRPAAIGKTKAKRLLFVAWDVIDGASKPPRIRITTAFGPDEQ